MPIKEGDSGIFSMIRGVKELVLSDDSTRQGELHFLPRRPFRPAKIYLVQTAPNSGKGYGKELLRAFVKRVGRGVVTTTEIVHDGTWETLSHLGLLSTAFTQGINEI